MASLTDRVRGEPVTIISSSASCAKAVAGRYNKMAVKDAPYKAVLNMINS